MTLKTRKAKAIALIQKQRQIEIQMMKDMKSYIKYKDDKYVKLKQNHIDRISILDYILMKIR